MNVFKMLSEKLGLSKYTLKADKVIEAELSYIQPAFSAHFDTKYPDYLNGEYKDFVQNKYPEYIKQHYDYIDTEESPYPYPDRPWYGLALSGGGIRSASFGIGVIQALRNTFFLKDKPCLFDRLVYQSSVSGGGYAGAALHWYQKVFNIFPFGNINSFAGSQYSQNPSDKVLSHIRQHGKYLTPHQLGASSLLGIILLSSFHSVVAYTLLFTALLYGAISLIPMIPVPGFSELKALFDAAMPLQDSGLNVDSRVTFSYFFIAFSVLLATTFLVVTFFYGFSSFTKHWFSKAYCYRIKVQSLLGKLLVGIIAALFFAILPLALTLAVGVKPDVATDTGVMATSITSGLIGGVLVIFNFYKSVGKSVLGEQLATKLITGVAVVLVVFSVFLLAYGLAEYLHEARGGGWPTLLLVAAFLVLVFVNINQVSPHKMYRDRLMETFMETPELPANTPFCQHSQEANAATLASLAKTNYWSPYHLINCNVILNNAVNPRFRGRAGDSFLLSVLYCGSDATDYVAAKDFSGGDLTLATAMSVSGAAANPYTGNSGKGPSLNPFVAFLMTFLGLRLGYWAFSPATCFQRMGKILRPNYILPGLHGLLDFGHSEKSAFIELSDGGHFDNTGIYELVRRRMPVIILSDGGADENFSFDDLGNAIERIRVDFGVSIRFMDPNFDLSGIMPGSQAAVANGGAKIYDEKYNLSERGYAIGDIVYPETTCGKAFVGRFVYIKATLTRNLPADLYAYKASHPTYPDQSTLDQFFDERQFEAYRELGYQLTRQMLDNQKAMVLLP